MVQKINGHFVQNGEWRCEGSVFHPSAPPQPPSYTHTNSPPPSSSSEKLTTMLNSVGCLEIVRFVVAVSTATPFRVLWWQWKRTLEIFLPHVCLFLCHQERTGGAGKCCGGGGGGVSLVYFVSYCKWVRNRSMHILKYSEGWVARKRVMLRVIT